MICGLARLYRCKEMWVQYGSGRSPGGGHGNPLQYSCLENPLDREAWRATVYRVKESNMTKATEHPCSDQGWRADQGRGRQRGAGRAPCQADMSPPHPNLWRPLSHYQCCTAITDQRFFYSFIQQSFEHLNKSTLLLNSNSVVLAPTEIMLQAGVSCSPITRAVFRCKKRTRPGSFVTCGWRGSLCMLVTCGRLASGWRGFSPGGPRISRKLQLQILNL